MIFLLFLFFVRVSPFYETVSLNFFKRRASLIVGGVYHLRKKHFLVPTFCVFQTLLSLSTCSGAVPVESETEPVEPGAELMEPGTTPVEPAAVPVEHGAAPVHCSALQCTAVEQGAVPGKQSTSRGARSLNPCHPALLQRLQGPCLALEENSSWSQRTSENVLGKMLFRCLLWGSLPCANKSLAFIFLHVELSEVRQA